MSSHNDSNTKNHLNSTETRRSLLGKLAAGAAALTLSRVLPGSAASAATVATTATAAKAWATGMNLDITFTVATKASSMVKKPYVAVWIEDANGKTLRNLTVWVRQGRANTRWLPEGLPRWMRDNSGLLATVSSATRNPGTYAVAWDGKTDKGAAAPQGDYYVCIESGREHGPYSLIRQKVTIGSAAFKKTLTPNNDLEAASLNFAKA